MTIDKLAVFKVGFSEDTAFTEAFFRKSLLIPGYFRTHLHKFSPCLNDLDKTLYGQFDGCGNETTPWFQYDSTSQ